MTRLERIARYQERDPEYVLYVGKDNVDMLRAAQDNAGLLRAAQAVVDAAGVYVLNQVVPYSHRWHCASPPDPVGVNTCTCGATALFTALAAFRAAEAKGST